MKLAVIRRYYSSVGGAELYLQRLLQVLVRKGHHVDLLTEGWEGAPEGVTVRILSSAPSRARRYAAFAEQAKRVVGGVAYDCVYSMERTVRQDVYRAGDGVHRVWLERRRQYAPWWRKRFIGWGRFHQCILRLELNTFDPECTRYVIANSEMVKGEIIEHYGFPAARIFIVRNGVEVERFRRAERAGARARFGVPENVFLLLFAGSGWERKGLKFVLRALERLSREKAHLLVVGKGRPPRSIGRNITFAGPISDIEAAYAAADLLLLLPIYEPSANVCFEAWAAGLPVVTTRYNGAGEILQHRINGSVVRDPANHLEVVREIEFWMQQPRGQFVSAGCDLSLERNARETMQILERAAEEKRKEMENLG